MGTYKIGIDIGSTTVKTVVLSDTGELLFRAYERHGSRARQKAAEQLRGAKGALGDRGAAVAVTGSAGLGVARAAGLPFSQEVYATAAAVRRYVPDADAAIELGGEDAKIIFFGGALEERMNGACAGGTGAFIDQMATLLGVSAPELDALALRHERVYPIASRCGVFAKSDIQPILNQGGRKEDVAASIFQAVVDQTVAGLTQGRELKGKIVFLGGPLTFLRGLRERFAETLELGAEDAVFPENADCFAALGAALLADGEEYAYGALAGALENAAGAGGAADVMPPLFRDEAEYAEFSARHALAAPESADAGNTGRADAYLGIDAGSTTTKLVLITESGGLLHSYYGSNLGDPAEIVRRELLNIYEKFGGRVAIRGSAVTGYGEELIKNAFNVDIGLVETMAHLTAARHFEPDVDFIIDIGGQDVKCFKIRSGAVDGIMLNEACSSGCGSFVETFAKALGYGAADFARLGLFAEKPVNLGSRCTVFMNSSVKQAQKDGASVEDISAGLSISVVKNAVYKVIRASSADELGRKIVAQGGTFLNDAVLRAFETEIGRRVTRPTIAGLMGAYGAALTAARAGIEAPSLLSEKELAAFTRETRPAVCPGCQNRCRMTVSTFAGGRRFISGNRCSRPLGVNPETEPNMMRWKYEKLRAMYGRGAGGGSRGKIGIPFGLNMYENLPFWFELLTRLDFEVELSPESSRGLYIKGQRTIPSDTVCYPAKLLHGHVEALLDAGVGTVFYPCLPYNFDEGISDNHYNCPVVAYYPELLAANMPRLRSARYLYPYFGPHRKRGFAARAAEYFERSFGVPPKETRAAVRAAYAAYGAFREAVRAEGRRCVEYAERNGKSVIVAAGRPYHCDPEINHGIDSLITSFGLVLITEDAVSGELGREPRGVLNQWTYQARMYNAARWTAERAGAELVQLVSFGCGTDAITGDEMRDILEGRGRLYTQIKIDDISNLGAARIRLRSLIAAMEERKRGSAERSDHKYDAARHPGGRRPA
ncbi:MAG: acyl-CoA dehydratase activase-related protein [Oscillospiraceae bacterium]|jgi:predicted CoA-substrate-specific enzyme activase|nr:acyl-CoA dehydratase activase-related protein [Oscillospiraceae bacterium]